VAVRVRDPRESALLELGLVHWVDAETGRPLLIDTSSARVRRRLAAGAEAHDGALSKLFQSRGVDVVDIDATGSYVEPLRRFFLGREGRQGRRRAR
jgi:hypothetical protein